MLRSLIERPVAVTMTLVAVLIVGAVSIGRLPVSLMPDIDVPRITVQAAMPGASAREVDLAVVQPLRRELLQLPSLQDIRCEAHNDRGVIVLTFAHGTDAGFNYVETNERIDRALRSLPEGVERPKVIRASATDIPAFFLDISAGDISEERFIELSRFVREVLSRRIEQIPEVAMVDASGLQGSAVLVKPDHSRIDALNIGPEAIENAIRGANLSLGNLTIRDGHYQWNVRFDAELRSVADIENVRLGIEGRVYRLGDLAAVSLVPAEAPGLVRSSGERAVTLAVIKQSDAQMSALRRNLARQMQQFREDYPELKLAVTRNQTELLDYSIDNLKTNILVGALLAVLVLLLFMREWRSPLLVALTIPASLIASMLLLYLFGVGVNIISLSGLILGIGMMVDNSIIVIDNITQWRERGAAIKEAAVNATKEVVGPMISAVLTTCSVFVPLIFLSGTAGALFYDQAMAVVVTLATSLVAAVFVLPVFYVLLYRRRPVNADAPRLRLRLDYERWYEACLQWVLRHQRASWAVFFGMVAGTVLLALLVDKRSFPPLTHDDVLLDISWNAPLSLAENDARASELINALPEELAAEIVEWSLLAGRQDFILGHSGESASDGARLYFKARSQGDRKRLEDAFSESLARKWPEAIFSFSEAANPFNLIFTGDGPALVAMIRDRDGSTPDPDRLNALIGRIRAERPDLRLEPVVWQEQVVLFADPEKMALYGIDYSSVHAVLSRATHQRTLLTIRSGSSPIPVIVTGGGDAADARTSDLLAQQVTSRDGVAVPLSYILQERRSRDLSKIVSGREGNYYPLGIDAADRDVPGIERTVSRVVRDNDFELSFSGGWYESRSLIRELALVLLVSLLLLFFILAAQFESLLQPLIILAEVAVDIFGALLALWLAGSSINLMSLIGIVVMAGIVINDSILKVDTINRLRRDGMPLLRAILTGGQRRLKPILMTSLTTIGAVAPLLVRGTMGADLQFPLSVALIGGMVVGTLVSLLFVPLFYYELYRGKSRTPARR